MVSSKTYFMFPYWTMQKEQ